MSNHKINNWGGPRKAGPGKKMGRPKGRKGRATYLYLDDATLSALKAIHPNISAAVRILAKTNIGTR